jgi:hypothetical protein
VRAQAQVLPDATFVPAEEPRRPLKPSRRPRVSPRSSASRRLPQNRHDMNAPLSWNARRMIKLLN